MPSELDRALAELKAAREALEAKLAASTDLRAAFAAAGELEGLKAREAAAGQPPSTGDQFADALRGVFDRMDAGAHGLTATAREEHGHA